MISLLKQTFSEIIFFKKCKKLNRFTVKKIIVRSCRISPPDFLKLTINNSRKFSLKSDVHLSVGVSL